MDYSTETLLIVWDQKLEPMRSNNTPSSGRLIGHLSAAWYFVSLLLLDFSKQSYKLVSNWCASLSTDSTRAGCSTSIDRKGTWSRGEWCTMGRRTDDHTRSRKFMKWVPPKMTKLYTYSVPRPTNKRKKHIENQ